MKTQVWESVQRPQSEPRKNQEVSRCKVGQRVYMAEPRECYISIADFVYDGLRRLNIRQLSVIPMTTLAAFPSIVSKLKVRSLFCSLSFQYPGKLEFQRQSIVRRTILHDEMFVISLFFTAFFSVLKSGKPILECVSKANYSWGILFDQRDGDSSSHRKISSGIAVLFPRCILPPFREADVFYLVNLRAC